MEVSGGRGAPWAAAAPLLCAAHCVAAPALLVFAPALVVNQSVEYLLMIVSAAIAIGVAFRGMRRHGELSVWLPLVAGLVFWGAGTMSQSESQEQLFTVLGAMLLATGVVWSARLSDRSRCTPCVE